MKTDTFPETFATLRKLLKPYETAIHGDRRRAEALLPGDEDVEDEIGRGDLVWRRGDQEELRQLLPHSGVRQSCVAERRIAVAAQTHAGEVVLQLHRPRSRACRGAHHNHE